MEYSKYSRGLIPAILVTLLLLGGLSTYSFASPPASNGTVGCNTGTCFSLSAPQRPPGEGNCTSGGAGCPNICYFYPQLCKGSSITTTVPGGGGTTTISGSGGCTVNCGGSGGSTTIPVLNISAPKAGCVNVSNLGVNQEYDLAVGSTSFVIVNNYDGNNYANITVNGAAYQLYQQIGTNVNGVEVTIDLLSVATGMMSMKVCYIAPVATTSTTTTATTAPSSSTTTAAPPVMATQSPPNPLTIQPTAGTLGGFALFGAGATRLRKRLIRGRKKHMKVDPGFWGKIEELGVIEAASLVGAVVLFISNYILLSGLLAFTFGITLTYMIDKFRSQNAETEYKHVRKQGVHMLMEEFGVAELIIFVATVLLFLDGYYIYGILGAFLFGVALTYFVDRLRNVEEIIKEQAAVAAAINLPVIEPMKAKTSAKKKTNKN